MFSQRAEGFKIEFAFRNAPPRPPVGPCFVGQGLEGQLQDLSIYRPMNAVELNHAWKLHAEQDLGIPLAPSAMDMVMYDEAKKKKKAAAAAAASTGGLSVVTPPTTDSTAVVEQPLHPDDEALVNWKGPMGDTAMERYQKSKDRARAAARLALANGQLLSYANSLTETETAAKTKNQKFLRSKKKKKKDFSRVLDRGMDFKFMKKTTYVANDFTKKVHDFTSLADTKAKEAASLDVRQKKVDRSAKAVDKTFAYFTPTTKLQHPTNKKLKTVWEMPLLPDVAHWGESYTHVVIDNPPKATPYMAMSQRDIAMALPDAFVSHVQQKHANERATCQLMIPINDDNNKKTNVIEDDDDDKKKNEHRPVAQYDLDVIPLKGEDDTADTNFCLWIDVEGKIATYLPVPSRINLTTGRPSKKATITNIQRRPLTEEEQSEILERTVQVDDDITNKQSIQQNQEQEEEQDTAADTPVQKKEKDDDDDDDNSDDDDNDGDEEEEPKTTAASTPKSATRQAAEDLNDDFGDDDTSDEDSDDE